jgi:hypothetical protein
MLNEVVNAMQLEARLLSLRTLVALILLGEQRDLPCLDPAGGDRPGGTRWCIFTVTVDGSVPSRHA